jgi:hypothetical protein
MSLIGKASSRECFFSIISLSGNVFSKECLNEEMPIRERVFPWSVLPRECLFKGLSLLGNVSSRNVFF